MAYNTPNMGLVAWDQGEDPYDHHQLASNFRAIDLHDHSPGKGKRITSAGIDDNAIISSKIADNAVIPSKIPDSSIDQDKLADNSVGTEQIINGSILGEDLADGIITNAKLSPEVNPLGSIRMWYRVNGSVGLPDGWEVLDGRPWSSVPNKLGPSETNWTTGNMPDFRNRFPLGAALSDTGSGATQPPDIGQVGGSMTIDLTHSHTVNAHTHTGPSHTHSIPTQDAHIHRFITNVWDSNKNVVGSAWVHARQRGSAVPGSEGRRQAFYVPELNREERLGEDVEAPMTAESYVDGAGNILNPQPAHNHSGSTGLSGGFSTGPASPGTNDALGSAVNHRNAYVGVLFLIRVI